MAANDVPQFSGIIKKSYSTPVAMIRELLNEAWNLLDDELKGYFQSTYDSH